jgi:hypothetical protein
VAKLKIRDITPFFITYIAFIIYAIYITFKEKVFFVAEGWGVVIVFALIIYALFIFFIDFFLKKWIVNYFQIVVIELTIIIAYLILFVNK